MADIKPTHRKHNKWHDYSKRCIYHITMVVRDRAALLGRLEGVTTSGRVIPSAMHLDDATRTQVGDDSIVNVRMQHLDDATRTQVGDDPIVNVRMQLTPLGMDVAECIRAIPSFGCKRGLDLQILAQQVMDTHIHFVLYVRQPMEKETLGDLIRGLKTGCNKALRKALESSSDRMGAVQPSKRIIEQRSLFEEDYDETILTRHGQLKRMIDYVHQNPYRKWVKISHRDCFMPVRGIEIAGRRYDAIGNLMLLGLKRFQVHCRYMWERAHDVEARRAHQNECILKGRLNYALVSPFVMDHERAVRDVALKEGHSIIQLMDNGFSDYTTCPGGLFDYCLNGQVLLLVPSDWPRVEKKGRCSREECVVLNGYAGEIVGEEAPFVSPYYMLPYCPFH